MEARVDSPVVNLLFDQNLSHHLVQALQKEFPDSRHVREVGLQEATDAVVWQYAAQQGFAIVTKRRRNRGQRTISLAEASPAP